MSPFTCQSLDQNFSPSSRGDWETHLFMDWSWNPPATKTRHCEGGFQFEVRKNRNIPKQKDLERFTKISTPCCSKAYHFSGLMSIAKVWDLTKPCLPSARLNPFGPRCIRWSTSFHLPATQLLCQLFLPVHVLAPKHWVFHSFGALDLNQKNCWSKWHIFNLPLSNKNLASFKYFMTRFHLQLHH